MTARAYVIQASPGGRKGRGGIASLVTYLATALPATLSGAQVEVLDTYGPGPVWAMPANFLGTVATLIIRKLTRRVDLLHIHMSHRGSAIRKPILAVLAIMMDIPTIMHLHGSVFDDYFRTLPPWRRRLLSRVLRRCDRVVVIGSHWHTFVVREVGLDPSQVALVHNGVPAGPTHRENVDGAPPMLLMLGELGARKGSPELIAALASADVRRTDWSATLAGNGEVDEYRAIVASLGLSSRVSLPGWQRPEQVRALLQQADILLLPSHDEGLPMAILEAMAAGVAIISTPVGAIPDAVIDGETGLLVPPGDPVALAAAIRRLLDDASLRRQLAANARARCEQMFTIDRTASRIATIYHELGIP